jgi:glycosyltransferase involved in cell wall biosynthesis
MRILQVNHGYPPLYNAGSEVYCQNLAQALARRGHAVTVFAREEDAYRPDYALRRESDGEIPVWLGNMPRTQHRYQHDALDHTFAGVVRGAAPEVVHFHHLNHLSLGLPAVAVAAGARVVFTVHDFWLVCPRGQLVQWSLGDPEPWALCAGQEDRRCAGSCYTRCHSGTAARGEADLSYWTEWVADRMDSVAALLPLVDAFVCPSRTAASALATRFPQVSSRIVLSDYGFPLRDQVKRRQTRSLTFGYIGTHAAPKGVGRLLRAFSEVDGDVTLRIWGRERGQETAALRRLADPRVSFEGEYRNEDVPRVLAQIDVLVVPSIWLENSPLVIHEAQQARVCVVTAAAGGMAEYVQHDVNGLLFGHRDDADLARQLRRFVGEPDLARRLGARGYLHRGDGTVPDIDSHAAWLEGLYACEKGANHAA